jgi:hypothetical protein
VGGDRRLSRIEHDIVLQRRRYWEAVADGDLDSAKASVDRVDDLLADWSLRHRQLATPE